MIQTVSVPDSIQRLGYQAVEIYERAISNGASDRFSQMLAARKPPGSKSDTQIFASLPTVAKECLANDDFRRQVERNKRCGQIINDSDVYIPTLARYPGDPAAFTSHAEGLGRLRKNCIENGIGCEKLGVKAESMPVNKCRLRPDLVEEIRQEKLAENPDLARANQNELRHEIIEAHGSPK